MQFFKTAGSSVYGPAFYQGELSRRPLSASFKYLAALVLIVSLFVAIPFAGIFSAASRLARESAASFPAALVVTVKDGVVSTNAQEPYFIAYKNAPEAGSDGRRNFIAIDTAVPESIAAFRKHDATVWIGKDFIISEGQGGKISIDQIPKSMNFTLSKQVIDDFSAKLHPYLPFIAVAMTLFFYAVIALASFAGALISALALALLIFLIEKLRKHDLSYRDSYRFALHALTLPILLSALFSSASFYFVLLGLAVYLANRHLPARS